MPVARRDRLLPGRAADGAARGRAGACAARFRCRGNRGADDWRRATTSCGELGLSPRWTLRRRGRRRAGAGRVARSRRRRRARPRIARAVAGGSPARGATRDRRARLGRDFAADVDACTACGLCRTPAAARCPASATSRPSGCSSARRRAPRKTRGASPSSARRAACSTTCWRRSDSRAARNVYIANVLKCRPPNNRTPEPRTRSAACRPYLDRQIALIAPEADRRAGQERGEHAARDRRDDRAACAAACTAIATSRWSSPTIRPTCCATCRTRPRRGTICCSRAGRVASGSGGVMRRRALAAREIACILSTTRPIFSPAGALACLPRLPEDPCSANSPASSPPSQRSSLAGCGYNDLQRQDEGIKAAWSEVLNQYQRRADLVPNLVNTVKGYAAQEETVLTEVTNARASVAGDQGHAGARQRSGRVPEVHQGAGRAARARCRGCSWSARTIRN